MKQWFRANVVLGLFLFPIMLGLISAKAVTAQVESGQIAGTVTDQSGAVVANATVTVTNLGTNAQRTVHTSATGSYAITSLAPATYSVSITAGNFQPYTAKVEVTVAGHVALDAKLGVVSTTEQVQVVAEGGAQVNTETQELSQMVSPEQVTQLPSLTRNPYDFVAIAGNVSAGDSSQGKSQNASNYGVGFSINGQRSTGTEILLDGVENTELFGDSVGLPVPVDAVSEYRILTSNYDPEFGRAAGGIVNVVTKSGSNQYHGTLWGFNRLSDYTANTVANAQSGVDKGTYTRNQFGFVGSGPAIKDKLFFTGSTEWLRVRSSANQISVVPTDNLLANSAANIQSFFNTYGSHGTFNVVKTYTYNDLVNEGDAVNPGGALSQVSGDLFNAVAFSAPSDAGGGTPQNTYNVLGRGDWNISDRTQVYGRYVLYHENIFQGADFNSPYSQYNVGEVDNDYGVLGNVTHEFSNSLLFNGKVSFSRITINQNYDTSLQNVPTLYASTNATIGGNYIQLPGFYDTNPGNGGLPYGGPQNVLQFNPDLAWAKNNHNFKFGAQILYIQSNRAYGAYAQAGERLGGNQKTGLDNLVSGDLYSFQVAVDPKGATPCSRDYLTGALIDTPSCDVTLPASSPSFARSDRFHDWGVYAQDAWKLTSRLTLNYGVRYEYFGVQHNSNPNLDSNFYFAGNDETPDGIRNGVVDTVPNSPIHSLWNPTHGAVSPRVGFAYDLTGNGKTSVRAGWGISYERNFGNVTFNVIQNPPNYATVTTLNTTVTNDNLGPLAGATGSVPLPPSSLRNVDQNIKTSQTQFWSGAIEHQLLQNTVFAVEYSGARGVHLYDIKDINGVGLGNLLEGDAVGSADQLSRLNSHYTSINNRGSQGDSYYEALNVRLQATNLASTGLSLTANYTYSHSIDDLSSTFSSSNNAFSLGYTEPFNPGFDRGSSDFDIRNRVTIAPIYALPYFRNERGLKGEALGNWQVAGIFTARTGTPFTFFDSTYVNGSGDFDNVPRYVPSTPVSKHSFKSPSGSSSNLGGGEYLLGTLPVGTPVSNPDLGGISDWGPFPLTMLGRNAFSGPGAWNLDLSLSKKFPLTERVNLEFRAEGYDILNHHNFYQLMVDNDQADYLNDDGSYTTPLILGKKGGVNGGANDERRFGQFALKLNF